MQKEVKTALLIQSIGNLTRNTEVKHLHLLTYLLKCFISVCLLDNEMDTSVYRD